MKAGSHWLAVDTAKPGRGSMESGAGFALGTLPIQS